MNKEKVTCEWCGTTHNKDVMITPDNQIYFCKKCTKNEEVKQMIIDFSRKGE